MNATNDTNIAYCLSPIAYCQQCMVVSLGKIPGIEAAATGTIGVGCVLIQSGQPEVDEAEPEEAIGDRRQAIGSIYIYIYINLHIDNINSANIINDHDNDNHIKKIKNHMHNQ